ncbi:hypothetical protein B0H14DRAFT_2582481 [Mycena olivaceomarginata]|nr:hypothetical protein B0H14DRAFT_2582481 [Mycena olivaceomarginata]
MTSTYIEWTYGATKEGSMAFKQITINRPFVYVGNSSSPFYDTYCLWDTIEYITKTKVKFKFLDSSSEGLRTILVDGNKPQANALRTWCNGARCPQRQKEKNIVY